MAKNSRNSGKPRSGQNGVTVTAQNFANVLTNGWNAKDTNDIKFLTF